MSMSEERKQYLLKYQKEKVRRVALGLSHAEYDRLKAAADLAGESVSGFIKTAISDRIDKMQSKN